MSLGLKMFSASVCGKLRNLLVWKILQESRLDGLVIGLLDISTNCRTECIDDLFVIETKLRDAISEEFCRRKEEIIQLDNSV